jgi:hypothetical protein
MPNFDRDQFFRLLKHNLFDQAQTFAPGAL